VSVVDAVQGLVEHHGGHRVISVYLDLDPERFATAPARASQIRSLIDEAAREVECDATLEHDEKAALREDLKRIDSYLRSREAPFRGARSLAIFSSLRDGLFEVVQLDRTVRGRAVIAKGPYVEPLIDAVERQRWCVVLVSRRSARILIGPANRLEERHRLDENVHGQHDQGGWSQANYERSVEKDAGDHLRRVAELIARRWQRDRFDRLALGGPPEVVPRLEGLLPDEVRARLAPERVEVDLSSATDDQVRASVARLVEEDEKRAERDALDRLAAGLGSGRRAVGGPQDTLAALNERRVGVLLLESGFNRCGARCPACALLVMEPGGSCPADGTELEAVEDLREAVVEAAIAQDAEVLVTRRYPDLGPHQGIAALLRF
jgi:peptide subunit release factor 1 (eRF1)